MDNQSSNVLKKPKDNQKNKQAQNTQAYFLQWCITQQIFIEHLLCVNTFLCTCWETIANETDSSTFS